MPANLCLERLFRPRLPKKGVTQWWGQPKAIAGGFMLLSVPPDFGVLFGKFAVESIVIITHCVNLTSAIILSSPSALMIRHNT